MSTRVETKLFVLFIIPLMDAWSGNTISIESNPPEDSAWVQSGLRPFLDQVSKNSADERQVLLRLEAGRRQTIISAALQADIKRENREAGSKMLSAAGKSQPGLSC